MVICFRHKKNIARNVDDVNIECYTDLDVDSVNIEILLPKGVAVKIGIFYDSSEPEARSLYEAVRAAAEKESCTVEAIDVASGKSAACICCFRCWVKTPGECVLPRDAGTEYTEKFWDAAYIVIISRITWGGYSMRIKSFVDRVIPILHPYFRKVNGEMHHKLRYDSFPMYLTVGYGARTEGEEDTFRKYSDANRDQAGYTRRTGTFIVGRTDAAHECAAWCQKEITR